LLGISQVFGVFDFLHKQVEQYCPACVQLLDKSEFMKELYAEDQESVPGVRYLNLVTRNDQLVTPFTRGLMEIVTKGVKKMEKTAKKIKSKLHHDDHQRPLKHGDNDEDENDNNTNNDDDDEDEDEDQDSPKELVMRNEDIQNMVLEDYCGLDETHSNHFALFRAPFTFSAIDAFLSPWEESSSPRELKCSLD